MLVPLSKLHALKSLIKSEISRHMMQERMHSLQIQQLIDECYSHFLSMLESEASQEPQYRIPCKRCGEELHFTLGLFVQGKLPDRSEEIENVLDKMTKKE